MTAFYYFPRGDASVTDPPQGTTTGSSQFYNFFQGKVGSTGAYFVDPITNYQTPFALSGDPVTQTGWFDGYMIAQGDRRQGLSSGPFRMEPNDTQEVVYAEIAAGGQNVIHSFKLLRYYDSFAQNLYDSAFSRMKSFSNDPGVIGYYNSDGIMINWGADENYTNNGYTFQGYNVYQLYSEFRSFQNAYKIKTFDKVDGITQIPGIVMNPSTGFPMQGIAQYGTDSGIQNNLLVDHDYVDNYNLVKGRKYYYAVTAYGYNASGNPQSLETLVKIISVTYLDSLPGIRYGQPVLTNHLAGRGNAVISATVYDPALISGHNYRVTFTGAISTSNFKWNLKDVTINQTILTNSVVGDTTYTVDGMKISVLLGASGVIDWSIPSGTRRFTFISAEGLGFEGFYGSIGYASPRSVFNDDVMIVPPDSITDVLLKLATMDTTTYNPVFNLSDPNVSYAYRFGRNFYQPSADPRFTSHILNTASGYSFQDFTKSVPLSAWDVSDSLHPRRLALAFLENNVAGGLVDGKWWPGDDYNVYNNTATTGPREWLWIMNSNYMEIPNVDYETPASGGSIMPIQYFVCVNRRGPVPFSPDGTGTDQFLIKSAIPLSTSDVFEFNSGVVTKVENSAKDISFALQQNYPNPFNPVTKIKFSLPERTTVRLEIFNALGQKVTTLLNQELAKGVYEKEFNGSHLASGMYIYRIEAGKYVSSKKMLLLK